MPISALDSNSLVRRRHDVSCVTQSRRLPAEPVPPVLRAGKALGVLHSDPRESRISDGKGSH